MKKLYLENRFAQNNNAGVIFSEVKNFIDQLDLRQFSNNPTFQSREYVKENYSVIMPPYMEGFFDEFWKINPFDEIRKEDFKLSGFPVSYNCPTDDIYVIAKDWWKNSQCKTIRLPIVIGKRIGIIETGITS